MDQADAELGEPDAEPGPGCAAGIAPRRAIVDEEGVGQAMAAKDALQPGAHRGLLLVGAGLQARTEARMIVD
jgi:hypothetical protein